MAESDQAAVQVSGVILAAGRSTRFGPGAPKQLHRVGGQTLVYRTAQLALASQLRQILVVTGFRGTEVAAALAGLAVEVVDNPGYRVGQAGSVKAGLARVEPEAEAVLFIPCDLPNLEPEIIDVLIAVFAESGGPIIVPTFAGRRMAPVLFDRSLFGEIAEITGDVGARQLFSKHEEDIVEVAFASSEPFQDLDRMTPE